MRKVFAYLFVFAIIVNVYTLACTDIASAQKNGNASECVPAADVPKLKSLALAGDGPAAWRLFREYSFCAEAIGDGEYWAHIAGENDPKFHGGYASVLGTYEDIDDLLRSLFWKNIDHPQRSVSALLTPAQSTLNKFNETFAKYASTAWRANPDVGIGTLDDVRAYNKENANDTLIAASAVTPESMWPLRVDALLGDPVAANVLAEHYYSTNLYAVFFYWKTISAENGNPAAELFLAETYGVNALDDQGARAVFWATRAVHDAHTPSLAYQAKYTQSRLQSLRNVTPAYMPVPPG